MPSVDGNTKVPGYPIKIAHFDRGLRASSMPPKQLSKLIRTEAEFAQTVVQGSFIQCVARMRLVKGDQVRAACGTKELPQ